MPAEAPVISAVESGAGAGSGTSGAAGVEVARATRALDVALLGEGAQRAVGHRVGDPVPVVLVLEVVQPVRGPDRAVVPRPRAVGGVDQEMRPLVHADEHVADEQL